ncbi:MAG TPA: type II toxin-antitoxin system RelE/ParE family toxin [Pyrinomonadaceae bacterium]
MTKYRFTSAALSELKEAILHYERNESGLGLKFLDEIDDTVDRILRFPRAWHPVSARSRRCRTHRFPFGLLYQVRSDEILITAVMDLRRDPRRWRDLI